MQNGERGRALAEGQLLDGQSIAKSLKWLFAMHMEHTPGDLSSCGSPFSVRKAPVRSS